MKKFVLMLFSLIFSLSLFSEEMFDTLDVEIPCTIKIFKADDYRVRIKSNEYVNWKIEDHVLKIEGDVSDEKETFIIIYTPIDQKIMIDDRKFIIKIKKED